MFDAAKPFQTFKPSNRINNMVIARIICNSIIFVLINLYLNIFIMNRLIFTLFICLYCFAANAQTPAKKTTAPKTITKQTVEIACGECKFNMEGKGCDLAIRIDGKPYFVDGKSVDDFGDAHDEKHGFCNVIKKAEVTGELVNNRFKAKTITLVPDKKKI